MTDKLLTRKETSTYLRVSQRTLYNYVKEKKIKVYRLSPRKTMFLQSDIDKFILRNK